MHLPMWKGLFLCDSSKIMLRHRGYEDGCFYLLDGRSIQAPAPRTLPYHSDTVLRPDIFQRAIAACPFAVVVAFGVYGKSSGFQLPAGSRLPHLMQVCEPLRAQEGKGSFVGRSRSIPKKGG